MFANRNGTFIVRRSLRGGVESQSRRRCRRRCDTKSVQGFSNSACTSSNNNNNNNIMTTVSSQQRRTFSSSSTRPPKLSKSTKRDLFLLAAGAVGISTYLMFSNEWDEDVRIIKDRLLESSIRKRGGGGGGGGNEDDDDDDVGVNNDHLEENNSPPPPVVAQYLEKALLRRRRRRHGKEIGESSIVSSQEEEEEKSSSSLQQESNRILGIMSSHQSGEFYALDRWYPFTANCLALSSNRIPGFVWEASVDIFGIPNRVLESYVNGQGSIFTKAWGRLPLIQVQEEEPYILFWLAMCPLFPFVLSSNDNNNNESRNSRTQQQGRRLHCLTWKATHDLSIAKAELVEVDESGEKQQQRPFNVEFIFREEDGLLERVQVNDGPGLEEPWQAVYKEYRLFSANVQNGNDDDENVQMMVLAPSIIEVGKGHGKDFRPHLKIHNHSLDYRE